MLKQKSQSLAVGTVLVAGVGLGVMTGGPSAMAALTLPALPAGCQIIRNELHPVQNTFRVEPGTPVYGVIGAQQTPFLQVDVRCEGPLSTPMTLGLNTAGSPDWQGPGRDIIPTGVKDVGLRLYARGEARGGTCSPAGWLGAGAGEWKCTLPAGTEGEKMLSLQVAAQVVKNGDNTPLQSTEALLPAKGGDVQLSVDGAQVPLLNSGAVAPVLVTPVTCTIESGKNDTIDFGQVRRNTGGDYNWSGNLLTLVHQPLSVSCQPAPTDKATYQVSISYNGTVYSGGKTFLKTSISDLFISGELQSGGSSHQIEFNQGQSLPLTFDAGTGHFTGNVDWALMNYSKTGQVPEEYGNFTATATYTVDVN
ncbi:type 1 fimbrial protein [Salmonella enterica subsp. enterica]|nr:type 1 fimbrial protein [Salmonella enterica]EDV4562106.1 type 1 fimbrial protein [Salmonella enterica subsp. enterica]